MPSFHQQVLAAWKAGLATEKKKLELCKTLLKSPHADQNQRELLALEVSGHENHIRMYEDLIKQATSPK